MPKSLKTQKADTIPELGQNYQTEVLANMTDEIQILTQIPVI